jgi:ferredoxin
LRIDAVACDGVGVCAHLAPDLIELDRWGYPVISAGDLSRREIAAAHRAVQGCPRKAMWIERVDAPAPAN